MITSYVLFLLSDHLFGVTLEGTIEILPWRRSRSVPLSYSYVEGLIDYRDVVYPVFNIGQRLGIERPQTAAVAGAEEKKTSGQSIILLEVNENPFGIIVDSVVKMARLDDLQAGPATLAGVDQRFIRGLAHENDREIMILDVERLLHAG